MVTRTRKSFYEIVTEAVSDMSKYGYDRQSRLENWVEKLRKAATEEFVSDIELEQTLRKVLGATYHKFVTKQGIKKYHKNVPAFRIDKLKPKLRSELDKRILANTSYIKIKRKKAVEDTLQRFVGWSTAIPAGGTEQTDKNETKRNIQKPLRQCSYEERRVIIDQGHKLVASINDVVAKAEGAIAFKWRSNWRQLNYNYREDHKERDDKIYGIKDSWAHKNGLINRIDGWSDNISAPAEEPMCQCYAVYIYDLDDIPEYGLTEKGRSEMQRLKAA
jgi:hypothetical protein